MGLTMYEYPSIICSNMYENMSILETGIIYRNLYMERDGDEKNGMDLKYAYIFKREVYLFAKENLT